MWVRTAGACTDSRRWFGLSATVQQWVRDGQTCGEDPGHPLRMCSIAAKEMGIKCLRDSDLGQTLHIAEYSGLVVHTVAVWWWEHGTVIKISRDARRQEGEGKEG